MRVPDMSATETFKFWRDYLEWQGRVSEAYRSVIPDAAEAGLVERMSLNMTDMLNALPYRTRHDLLGDYRRLIRFDDVMDAAKSSGGLRTIGKGQYGDLLKFSIDQDQIDSGNPLAVLLNRMNIQHDPMRPLKHGVGQAEEYYFGSNILRTDAIKAARDVRGRARNLGVPGKKVFIFDTETTGLATDVAGVREVGGGIYTTDLNGKLHVDPMDTAHFRTARMEMGSIWSPDLNKTISLGEDEMRRVGKTSMNMVTGSGEEFADKLIPFLKNIIEADHIAGHNVEFDLRQTLENLMRTSAYKNGATVSGVDIRSLVDQAVHKVSTGNALIDTRELLMQAMPNMPLAAELRQSGKLAPYSLENVMLNSNLARLMIGDMGDEAARKFFVEGAAQHSAEYDTTITAYLMKYLNEGTLLAGSRKDALGRTGLEGIIRANTIKAGATVPTAHIKDITHMDPELFRELIENKDPRLKIRNVHKNHVMDLSGRSVEEWIDELSRPDQTKFALDSGVSYMEQSIWAQRRAQRATVIGPRGSTEDIVNSLGQWRDTAGITTPYEGFLNRNSSLFKMGEVPSQGAFDDMVHAMASVGNPFATLSMQERKLTSGLSRAASAQTPLLNHLGVGVKRAASVADDLGIIHFAEQQQFYGAERIGQNVSLPLDIMKEAERQNIIGSAFNSTTEAQMLKLSAYEGNKGKAINLAYELSGQQEASDLANWVSHLTPSTMIGDRRLDTYGISSAEDLAMIARNIELRGTESGIAVGYMRGEAGERAYSVMEDLFGSARDRGRPNIKVVYGDSMDGAVMTGPAVLDELMNPAERSGLRGRVDEALAQFGRVSEHFEDASNFRAFQRARAKKSLEEGGLKIGASIGEIIKNADYSSLYASAKLAAGSPRGKLAIAGAAIGLGAYYMFRRHKSREPYLEPFDARPIENPNPPPRIIDQPAPQESRLDPMATSNVVGNLDANRTNHAIMGTGKYSNLFGGAI